MQPGCDEIEFLISKSVDGEATPEERALVDSHVASCDACACKLTSFMEMAAVFTNVPLRTPDTNVRSGVFSEIKRLKEAEQMSEVTRSAPTKSPTSPNPGQPPMGQTSMRRPSIGSRLWSVGSPFAVMGSAVAVLIVIMTLAVPPDSGRTIRVATAPSPVQLIPDGVGTVPVASVHIANTTDTMPVPVETHAVPTYRVSTVSATVHATATFIGDKMLELSNPTVVLEMGDQTKISNWHLVRDPAYGYSISYPPNWWTQVVASTRYFYPWGPGGVKYAPYSIEFLVQDNPHGYTAETANEAMFKGACKVVTGITGKGKCLQRVYSDADNNYYELYVFDPGHIYLLRSIVPLDSSLGDFQTRFQQAQLVLSRMSGSIVLAATGTKGASGYGPVLFLNGSDLWAANTVGSGVRPVTHGYMVRQFALSPDLRHVAYSATNDTNDKLADARYIYITDAESGGSFTPQLLDASLTVYDIAWYSDRSLLAIGKDSSGLLGVYMLPVSFASGSSGESLESTPQLLTALPGMNSASGLSVSPDRQLITFLAPLGESQSTDIYALRPDGKDLHKVVTHNDALPFVVPTSPGAGVEEALTQDTQAIKSYTWLDGRLENGQYILNMLITVGTFKSSSLYRGGFLYSAGSAGQGTILDPSRLNVEDPAQVQVVHVAYAPQGKVAFTGFYYLRDNWAEELAGLWTADLVGGSLVNLKQQPIPASHDGISDLQWSPDDKSLIYRETMPRDPSNMVSKYIGESDFKLIRLDPQSGQQTTLYDATH